MARGWRVFPIVPRGKQPLTPNGFKDATTDVVQVQKWWDRYPYANIGLALDESTVVIDVDPRNGGVTPEGLPETLTVNTGGGGQHYYFRTEISGESQVQLRKTLITGVDIKTEGGYVLLPPSVTISDYRWVQPDTTPAFLPEWLANAIQKPEFEYVQPQIPDDPNDQRPGSIFNRTHPWAPLLSADGWTKVGEALDGEEFWCRPGKTSGISATTNYNQTGLLYVFSSNAGLESDRAYTQFAYVTETKYGGDYSLAAKSVDISGGDTEWELRNQSVRSTSNGNGHMNEPNNNTKERYGFVPAFSPGGFVSDFIGYVQSQTDAPLEYAEAAALVLVSIGGYRCKAQLAPYPGGLSNNLYVLLVGPTTVSRKSTVQRIASNLIKAVMPPSVLPNRSTTEALIKSLSNRSGVPSVWAPDEFGVTLAQIYQRDFMAGLEEMLLTVYSGDDYVYERVLDTVTIRSPHLSVLAAATPESLARAGATALDSGLLPRFAIVYPQVMPTPRAVDNVTPNLTAVKQGLTSRLHKIVQWSDTQRDISFSKEALEYLNTAEGTLAAGSAARLPTMLYKVASLSAISECRNVVSLQDAASAATVVARWSGGVAAIVPEMYKHSTDQQFELQLEYVLEELKRAGGSLTRIQVANMLNIRKTRLDDVMTTLVDKGKIVVGNGVWTLVENN